MTRIFKYVSRYKGLLFFGTFAMIAVIGIDLFMPYLQKVFIDEGIIQGNYSVIKIILI